MVLTGGMFLLDVAVNVLDALVGLETSVKLASFEAVRTILHAGSLFSILACSKEIREKLVARFPRYFRSVDNEQPLSLRSRSR